MMKQLEPRPRQREPAINSITDQTSTSSNFMVRCDYFQVVRRVGHTWKFHHLCTVISFLPDFLL